jgi:hypothetical protein
MATAKNKDDFSADDRPADWLDPIAIEILKLCLRHDPDRFVDSDGSPNYSEVMSVYLSIREELYEPYRLCGAYQDKKWVTIAGPKKRDL